MRSVVRVHSIAPKATNKDRSIRERVVCVSNPRNIVEEPFDSDSVVVHDLLVPVNKICAVSSVG